MSMNPTSDADFVMGSIEGQWLLKSFHFSRNCVELDGSFLLKCCHCKKIEPTTLYDFSKEHSED
jgi:hypothetical protein